MSRFELHKKQYVRSAMYAYFSVLNCLYSYSLIYFLYGAISKQIPLSEHQVHFKGFKRNNGFVDFS